MRVTQSLLLRNGADSISASYSRLFEIQQQISSGKRLLQPSDDPSAIRPLFDVHAGRRHLAQVKSNAELASAELGAADDALQQASDLVAQAQQLAVQGGNGTLTQKDRSDLASQVDALLDQLVSVANRKGGAGSLFAGGATDATPYQRVDGPDGTVVLYHGNDHTSSVDLGDTLRVDLRLPGSRVFVNGTRGPTQYDGTTGAAAGSGNDSLRGTDHLVVAHTRTVLGDGALLGTGDSSSGLQVGASSASGDTVLGLSSAHSITLVDTSGTGASGTVSLDGGAAVNWSASDGDLAVTAANGDVVHLDLRNVTAGFTGTVAVAGEGSYSLDGGTTTTAIDFAQGNQIVRDSVTGSTLFVDSRNVARSGSDVVRAPGSYDLFASLVELRDALKNTDGQPLDTQLARIQGAAAELQTGENGLLSALSTVGARMDAASSAQTRADALDQSLAARQSSLEDVDVTSASIDLAQAQLVLQAGVQVSAKIAQLPSLSQLL